MLNAELKSMNSILTYKSFLISSRCPGTASSPGRREEVEPSVQWCCFVPQSEQRRHSARSAGGWCCRRSVVGACSP